MFGRIGSFIYGVACYGVFFVTFLYAIGFLGNIVVPTSIDSNIESPLGVALLVNLGLLAVFGLQHSVMARPGFKRVWTRVVPKHVERSTYVLFSSLALILLFWQWRPMGGVVWQLEGAVPVAIAYTIFGLGWLTVLVTTFLINHFDLFGLRQVWVHLLGKEYTHVGFVTPGPYKHIRHPLYVGWLMCFWATPVMTLAHLVFAIGTTAYILVAIYFEERDLLNHLGHRYAEYRARTPMFIPAFRRKKAENESTATA